jgi:phage regulator Rha-like protein
MNEIILGTTLVMSSKELAELTAKDHGNVLRDIRTMLKGLDDSDLSSEQYQILIADNNMTSEILLDKELSVLLVSGYNVQVRLKIIRRWQELEANQKPKTQLELAREQVVLLERLEAIEIERANLKVTLDMAHDWSSIKRMEMRDGKKYFYPPLRNYSKSNGYEVKKVFDQNYGEVNSYHKDVWEAIYGVVID